MNKDLEENTPEQENSSYSYEKKYLISKIKNLDDNTPQNDDGKNYRLYSTSQEIKDLLKNNIDFNIVLKIYMLNIP